MCFETKIYSTFAELSQYRTVPHPNPNFEDQFLKNLSTDIKNKIIKYNL